MNDTEPIGDLLQSVTDLVDEAASAPRADVVRTRHTEGLLDLDAQTMPAVWCTRCDSSDRLDDMVEVWCRRCGSRGFGYPA